MLCLLAVVIYIIPAFYPGDRKISSADEADGIHFLCPGCLRHSIHLPNVRASSPNGWIFSGASIEDFTALPSVKVHGCKAHFHIVQGECQMCPDSGV